MDSLVADIKGGLNPIFLFTGGAGVEYFLSERFSIDGEFNYRLLAGSWEYGEYDDWIESYYDPINDTTYNLLHWNRNSMDVGGVLGGTSAGVWLNYYF